MDQTSQLRHPASMRVDRSPIQVANQQHGSVLGRDRALNHDCLVVQRGLWQLHREDFVPPRCNCAVTRPQPPRQPRRRSCNQRYGGEPVDYLNAREKRPVDRPQADASSASVKALAKLASMNSLAHRPRQGARALALGNRSGVRDPCAWASLARSVVTSASDCKPFNSSWNVSKCVNSKPICARTGSFVSIK